jgi:hypothetical protein
MTNLRHRTLRSEKLRLALVLLLAALLPWESASALPVEVAGRDADGVLQFRPVELATGEAPSAASSLVVRNGRIVLAVAPESLSMAPLAVGPIFAKVRTASAGSVTVRGLSTESVQTESPRPSIVSHTLELSEPPSRTSSMVYGGVAPPAAPALSVASPPQPTVVGVTISGTVGTNPVSNPLPGAVWLFATGLGLLPVLLRRDRR